MFALHSFLLFHVLTCLGQNAHGSDIINGEKAAEGSMQYMVSLQNSANHHVCGGFLIREDFVVTAAHCDNPTLSRVVLGTHNLKKVNDGKIRFIKKKHKHSYYTTVGLGYDIMLLELQQKVELDNRVKTIPLPSPEENINKGTWCRVAGWGFTRTGGAAVDELRVVDVSVIGPQVCRNQWNGLPDNVICAGGYGTNKGFCQGDSGGPLVCNGKAVGVVSFNQNANCDYPHVPNVYTDVSKYLDWINGIINL